MAETSSTDSPHPDELEYGSEPANEVEAEASPRARGRKRRSAEVNNGVASQSTSVEPKDPAQGKRARGEEAGGKRVRKANPMFADYLPTDKKTAHTLLGQEPTNGKGRKEVLMTPAEARTKKLAKGYQYVAAEEAKPQADFSQLPGKRERKKPVHADFVDDAPAVAGGTPAKPGKKISVTISNPNTNPTLSTNGAVAGAAAVPAPVTGAAVGGRRGRTSSGSALALSSSGGATPEPALLPDPDDKDKPAKRTRSEQSRQAKLDFTLTMLNDQLAAVTSSIRNKETVSLPPVEPEPSNSIVDSPPSNDQEMVEESEEAAQPIPESPVASASYPTTPSSNRGRSKKVKSESGGRAKRAKPRPQSPPSPQTFSTSRPVRTRKVRTPSAIAGDTSQSRGLVKCQEMVRELLKHEDAWPFAKPVDPVQLNIPDYFDIIKHPMDLGTVKTQLNNGHYDSVEALADDIRLVFINTRTYNKADSDIVIMAKGVEELFERRLETIKSMGIDDLDEDEEPQGNAKIEEKIQQLSSQLKVATAEILRLKKDRTSTSTGTPSATPAKKVQGRPRDDNRPMSFEEKRRLSVQINNLSSEKLMKVVQIIHESNPKVAQSSAPDVIEIDIDALDTSTLRHLERVVRQSQPRQRSTSSASATSPAPNRLAQAELAASGTKERIADVKRQLDALNRSLGTKSKKNTKSGKKGEDEDVIIDDDAPKGGRDSDSGSSSDSDSSDSSSESDSSETSSDSDSESDQEQAAKPTPPPPQQQQPPPPPPPSKLPTTTNVPKFPSFGNAAITPVAMPITTNPILPTFPQSHSTLASFAHLTVPPTHDGLVMYTNDDVPEIKPSTGTKKAPEAISWNTSVLETPIVMESPVTPPPVAAGATDQMWSQFQNKNILQKQKEKEREEQEELLRKEREEREEERKKEEERRKKEQEEAEVRKLRDSEAEKEQKKKEMMEQRAKAKEERERMQGKNMSEQSDMMASFERENRSLPSQPFQLSSLDLQSLATSSPTSFSSVPSNAETSSESTPASTSESTSESTDTLPPPTESTPDTLSTSSDPPPPPPLDSQPSVIPA